MPLKEQLTYYIKKLENRENKLYEMLRSKNRVFVKEYFGSAITYGVVREELEKILEKEREGK